jgi:prepilin-type processing-associated H-X9-DG protein
VNVRFLRNVLINASSAVNQRRWIRLEAERLGSGTDPQAAMIARALTRVLDHGFLPAERDRMRAVEALRRRLLTSFGRLEASEFDPGRGTRIARAALSSKSPFWARVLFSLIRESRPESCLELGTNMGISAAYQASALKLNGAGTLVSLEGAKPRARTARRNLAELGLDNVEVVVGPFRDTLPEVLRGLGAVNYAFIDGHHDEQATKRYFELIASNPSSLALVVLDDISWSDGMRRAWSAIEHDPRVRLTVDLHVLGLCVMQ